ncbi:MAG TPA: peptidoglycan DD-metalloendopeptidase family protein [Brevefilum sp.]|nr:peptidoglycan DD-metalloendopeptidase family protein [Brevefilum sp.]HOR18683.1 peptidoglycan DD-metalloendopeptidase family protein [Brevefilum sp.]HPL68584.1 peptidoglycan DD-metalloendopeptidase family protein [Brevefilum sp.]
MATISGQNNRVSDELPWQKNVQARKEAFFMTKSIKFGIIVLILLSASLIAFALINPPPTQGSNDFSENIESPTDPSDQVPTNPDLISAVESALKNASGHWKIFNYQIEHTQIQDDGQMAIVWLAAEDPETGEIMAREPELTLAIADEHGNWGVLLEDNPKFIEAFSKFQYAEKSIQGDLLQISGVKARSDAVFGGYYLPWAEGLEKRLTWSVAHSSCNPIYYCTHAFDFADGTMFPIMAAKGGTVFHWRDSCPNNTPTCTNSITLQDKSTTPWTYQIYLHIANNSIPEHLKQVGTPVTQGQFIANVDNTGYSTGHHLHFMVVTEDTRYFSQGMQSVWGVAEDITFRDVSINWNTATQGGRPRLAYEAETYGGVGKTYYISGNKPAKAPTGGLTAPAAETYVTNRNLSVAGWGEQNVGVVKLEILANYDGAWVQIGSEQTKNPFTTTVDLCNTSIPNGLFQLALRVWDNKGNPSGILTPRTLIKNIECSTTDTNPSVSLVKTDGLLLLPVDGHVGAIVNKGSKGRNIASVEFWFHGQDWENDDWVYLGKDTSETGGWTGPINTAGMDDGDGYAILALVTDAGGKTGMDVIFDAIVDRTGPWISINPLPSPFTNSKATITWTGGDLLSGLKHYSLSVRVNGGAEQVLASNLPPKTTSYTYNNLGPEQLLIFSLIAVDRAGNSRVEKIALYTPGYEFEYGYHLPLFFMGE